MAPAWLVTCVAALCIVFQTTAWAAESKEKELNWSKKSSAADTYSSVRGQRSPSTSRFKAGPAAGSWYYIMGHGHDTKRTVPYLDGIANEIDSNPSSHSTAYHAGFGHLLPLSSSPSLTSRNSPLLRFHPLPTSAVKQPAAISGSGADGSAYPVTSRTSRHPGGSTAEANNQQLLNEFLNFLVLKEMACPPEESREAA